MPEKRATRVTQQYTAKDVAFVKALWNLTELPIATKFSVVVAGTICMFVHVCVYIYIYVCVCVCVCLCVCMYFYKRVHMFVRMTV
jgi:hypothetical protein